MPFAWNIEIITLQWYIATPKTKSVTLDQSIDSYVIRGAFLMLEMMHFPNTCITVQQYILQNTVAQVKCGSIKKIKKYLMQKIFYISSAFSFKLNNM